MYCTFESLPDTARVWVFQAHKKLTNEEKNIISKTLSAFTEQWLVHGTPMQASFKIEHDLFIVLAANDQASGCSIDHSVRVIKQLGQELNVNFFDRNLIAFKDGGNISMVTMQSLGKLYAEKWTAHSLVFNNLVETVGDLRSRWLVPAETTWLKRYIPKEKIV